MRWRTDYGAVVFHTFFDFDRNHARTCYCQCLYPMGFPHRHCVGTVLRTLLGGSDDA